ncbi:translation initiation factor IF-2 [Candidatus Gracilibacteria bacterium]|nr:translation initiation factor IF-2 [Candidatus Gracilibacteria bacterium]MCF7819830.1 translation initiation factor IF-2 [Candidatus Gracilibacteria bacterium]
MPISVAELAKQLDIAPEAVQLHAMDLNFEIGEDEMVSDEIAAQIRKIEQGDEIRQVEHEIEEELEREIIEKQQERTAGQKKAKHRKKKDEPDKEPEVIIQKADDGSIVLPDTLTVREFALKISKPIPIVLVKLKQNGIIANLTQEIDYETAAVIADELGVKVKKEAVELSGEDLFRADLSQLLDEEDEELLESRPPIISIMGHVDHGKTSILDYIRKTKVAEGEAGGITQKIGAYQIDIPSSDKKSDTPSKITFLDTPGHEAFTVMRARGARATDVAVLVVAATEGLKPQSLEAINHAREANIPIIVAINKMDLEGANPDQVKGQLAENDLNPEDWGGDTPCIEVSAKTGKGIEKLLETIQLVAEMQELKANPNRNAICTVIESSLQQGIGVTATVLVNTGTLKKSDAFVIYDQHGKIRTMTDFSGKNIKSALPSTPVQVTGLEKLPQVGDILQIMENEKAARRKAEEVATISHEDELSKRKKFSLASMKAKLAEGKMHQLKVIVKAGSKGSLEAVINEIEKVKTEESFCKVVHSGVGEITESDIMLASAGDALVVGFNAEASGRIEKLAEKEDVLLFSFDVIYHLTEKINDLLLGKLEESETETSLGTFKIKKVFATNKKMAVIGGDVVSGKVRKLSRFRLVREEKNEETGEKEEKIIGEAKINSVQLGQKEVNEVNEGTECGMKVDHKELTFQEGDRLELFMLKK